MNSVLNEVKKVKIFMLKEEIGKRIKNIRLDMNLSKQDFAKLLGISGQYLGMVERGNGSLSFDKLQTLCNLTGLSADYILFGKDPILPIEVKNNLSEYTDEQINSGLEALEKFALFLKNIN